MSPTEPTSADLTALDSFVDRGATAARPLWEAQANLAARRAGLLTVGWRRVPDRSEVEGLERLLLFMAENRRFVADVATALHAHGRLIAGGVFTAPSAVVNRELERTDDQRLEHFEETLVEAGVDPAEAAALRVWVDKQLEADRSLGFHDAVLLAVAAYRGVEVDELARAERAFRLGRTEAVTVVADHFDTAARRTGVRNQITIDDLAEVVADPDLPDELRDAAYRLAADAGLFTDLDVALQTDLTEAPFAGFAWSEADGILGRDDFDAFAAIDYQHRILSAWLPLVDTADDGYDLGKADSHIGVDAVTAFISDQDIPAYVRLAVFDAYAERFDLRLERREAIVEEWALATGAGAIGTQSVLTATAAPTPGTVPVATPPRTSAGAAGGAGGGGASVVAAAFVAAVTLGWRIGRHEAITRAGDPGFVHVEPATGHSTRFELDAVAGLSPAETKAWVAYISAYGEPPPEVLVAMPRHPYLDVDGQWRWSHTNEPVHAIDPPSGDSDSVELVQLPPAGTYRDASGLLRYEADDAPFDGYALAPIDREEFLTEADLKAEKVTVGGKLYERRQVSYHPVLDADGQHVRGGRHGELLYEARLLGDGGRHVTSTTLLRQEDGRPWHIDLENPDPGGRPAQLHLQYKVDGKQYRHIFDFNSGQFRPNQAGDKLPRNIRKWSERDPLAKAVVRRAARDLNVPDGRTGAS